MSASDQLRNLHAEIEDLCVIDDEKPLWELAGVLPLIADAIAAAEQYRQCEEQTDWAQELYEHQRELDRALAVLDDALKDTTEGGT